MWSDMRGRNICSERSSLFLVESGLLTPTTHIQVIGQLPPLSPASAKLPPNTPWHNTTQHGIITQAQAHQHSYTPMKTLHSLHFCGATMNIGSAMFICNRIHSCKQVGIPLILERPSYTNTPKWKWLNIYTLLNAVTHTCLPLKQDTFNMFTCHCDIMHHINDCLKKKAKHLYGNIFVQMQARY